MTIGNPLGEHHKYARSVKLRPSVRGTDYARGKSPLRFYNGRPRTDRRLSRIRERIESVLAKNMHSVQALSLERKSYEQETPISEDKKELPGIQSENTWSTLDVCNICPYVFYGEDLQSV